MNNEVKPYQNKPKSITQQLMSVFGDPPILPSEDETKYWLLAARVAVRHQAESGLGSGFGCATLWI